MFLWEGLEVYCPHCGHSESTKVKEGFLDNFEDDLTVGEQHQTLLAKRRQAIDWELDIEVSGYY